MENKKEKLSKFYKVLNCIFVVFFAVDFIVRFSFSSFIFKTRALFYTFLIVEGVFVLLSVLTYIYANAVNGVLVLFPKSAIDKYPFGRMMATSAIVALIYMLLRWIPFAINNGVKGVFWVYMFVLLSFAIAFIFVFANLTLAWFIAKKKQRNEEVAQDEE